MKSVAILAILMALVISGCVSKGSGNVSQEEIGVDIPVHINVITIEGHKYIVLDNKRISYGGGVAIIHAESCQCKSK